MTAILRRDLPATESNGVLSRAWYNALITTQQDVNNLVQATLYTDTGAVNAMVIASGLTAYKRGVTRYVKPAFSNTSTTVTLNDSGLGAKPVKLSNGSNPSIGQLVAGATVQLQYDGSVWDIVNLTATDLLVPGNLTVSGNEAITGNSLISGTLGVTLTASLNKTTIAKALSLNRVTVLYSASMTPDASLGNQFSITANNGTAFTINAPTNPTSGQPIRIIVKNASGGALGAATWNAVFKMSAWTNPGNGFNRSIEFEYDGTNWIQASQTGVDVPN